MTQQFEITGMTCSHCVARVKKEIENLELVEKAEISLDAPQATITLKDNINIEELQAAVQNAGDYEIHEIAKL
jgi:copper chaperone CopZ